MQRPIRTTLSPTADDPNGIALTQTPGAGGNLTLAGVLISGGVATFATPQHVTVSSNGIDTTRVFTVTGTNREGVALTDTITGVNATTITGDENFATVTQIAVDDATAGAITAGVDGTCDGRWLQLDQRTPDPTVTAQIGLGGGTMTYTVQSTLDSVFASDFDEIAATAIDHSVAVGDSADQIVQYAPGGTDPAPVAAIRLQITAHTSGAATFNLFPVRGF